MECLEHKLRARLANGEPLSIKTHVKGPDTGEKGKQLVSAIIYLRGHGAPRNGDGRSNR
jgi:hypothetical protein